LTNEISRAAASWLNDAKKEHYASLMEFIADEMAEGYWNIFL